MAGTAPPSFGDMLKEYRLRAGLTQETLAERARISARAVSDLERGINRAPRPVTLALLARALELDATDRKRLEEAGQPFPRSDSASDGVPQGSAPAPLVGRERELDLLDRHLLGEGPPGLFLTGEPGIGKSRLLAEAAHRGMAAGWSVLYGGCTRSGGELPYTPLLQALQRHIRGNSTGRQRLLLRGCAWLVRLLPELADGPIEPLPRWTLSLEQERRLMFGAVERFLANTTGPAGTLLVLDDLQWAGADALQLLTAVLHGPGGRGVRVVGAYRDTEVTVGDRLAQALADLAQSGLAGQIRLAPLAPEPVVRLLDGLLPDMEGVSGMANRREMVRLRAGGVPFFIVSCAQALRQVPADEEQRAMPWDIAQSVRQRVALLPESARLVLGVAAVAGRDVPRIVLTAAARLPEEVALAGLEEACRARLLEEQGADDYRFPHDLIREVVEADLGAGRRALLHRRVGETLERLPGSPQPAVLAFHYLRGGERERADGHLERAGDQARAQGALSDAEQAFRGLVACLDALGRQAESASARERLGDVLAMLCRYDEALDVFDAAAHRYRAGKDREGLRRVTAAMGWAHGAQGTPESGLSRLSALLAQEGEGEPSPGLTLLLASLAALYTYDARYEECLVTAERAAAMARQLGDEAMLVHTGRVLTWALVFGGREEEALRQAHATLRLAETIGAVGDGADLHHAAAHLCEIRGEFDQGKQLAASGVRSAEQLGIRDTVGINLVRLGAICFFSGDWEEARAHNARALAISAPSTEVHFTALLHAGQLHLAEGSWELAESYLRRSSSMSRQSRQFIVHKVVESHLAELDILTGRPEAARARLLPLLEEAKMEELVVSMYVLPRFAWAALELGLVDQATATIEEALRRERAHDYRLALLDTLRVQGMLFAAIGDRASAADAFEEGLSRAREIGCPYGEARLLFAYGRVHHEVVHGYSARERLEAALGIFRRLGARKDSEQAELLLNALD